MQSIYVASATPVKLHLPRDLAVVALFCLLGISLSVAVLSLVPADELAPILAYF